jgi:hypothetical protein
MFYVGQQVVCIDTNYSREPTWRAAVRRFPELYMVYTIRSIRFADPLIGFCFEEIVHPPAHFSVGWVEPAFDSRRFRPVKKTSIEVFRKLLLPTDPQRKCEPETV